MVDIVDYQVGHSLAAIAFCQVGRLVAACGCAKKLFYFFNCSNLLGLTLEIWFSIMTCNCFIQAKVWICKQRGVLKSVFYFDLNIFKKKLIKRLNKLKKSFGCLVLVVFQTPHNLKWMRYKQLGRKWIPVGLVNRSEHAENEGFWIW